MEPKQPNVLPLWWNIFLFSCVGVTAEVFFTAGSDLLEGIKIAQPDVRLMGKSYVWMVLAYGSIPVFLPMVYRISGGWNQWLRLMLVATLIIVFEFCFGGILRLTTGKCPWEYTTGIHVMGLARLDYFPAWMGFGWLVERVYFAFNPGFHKNN